MFLPTVTKGYLLDSCTKALGDNSTYDISAWEYLNQNIHTGKTKTTDMDYLFFNALSIQQQYYLA
jgi:hypothetical protein